jgi:phage gp37-like protein
MSRLDDPLLLWAIELLNYADPDETSQHMVLADDLILDRGDRPSLERAADRLATLHADQTVANAEIKGLLNRASGRSWGVEYERAFGPRAFLAELERAIREYLRRHAELR